MKAFGCGTTFDEVTKFVSEDKDLLGPGAPDKITDLVYQTRFAGCLLERANTLFWMQVQVPKSISQIVLLEDGQKI